jgi:phosphoglycerol transferase MdoB-like AlkP superfamily enzyme
MKTVKLKSKFVRCLILLGLAGMMSACASTHVAVPDTGQAESMVKQAQQAGAHQYAKVPLNNAEQKIKQAKAAINQKDNQKATRLTEEASVDAKLAMVTSRSKKARDAVKQLHKTIQALQQEIQQNQQK